MSIGYFDVEDLYDLGEMLKKVHSINYELWKKNKDSKLKESNLKLMGCIDEIDEICREQGICPFCGHEIETIEVEDNVCGDYTITKCSGCGEEF